MTACGKDNANNSKLPSNSAHNQESISNETEGESTEETSLLFGTYKVPLREIYIDIPALHMIEEGYTRIFIENEVKYIAFTCLRKETASSPSDAFDKTFEHFKNNIDDCNHIDSIVSVDYTEMEINGIKDNQFKGQLNVGRDPIYNVSMYGYSFIFDGCPCSLIGIVQEQSQPQAEIDYVKETIDAMMASVRNTK